MALLHIGKAAMIRAWLKRSIGTTGFILLGVTATLQTVHAEPIGLVNRLPFSVPWDSGPRLSRILGLTMTDDGGALLARRNEMALMWSSRVNQKLGFDWAASNARGWPDDVAGEPADSDARSGWAMVAQEFSSWP